MTQDQLPTAWRQGMQRAISRHLKATLTARGTYRVHSGSRSGRDYEIELVAGKLGPCQCEAMTHYGETFVCAHRGAAALAFFALHGVTIEPAPAPAPVRDMTAILLGDGRIHGPLFRCEDDEYAGVRA